MKSTFILLFGLMISTNALAISNDELVEKCFETGKEKIYFQADVLGCKVSSPVEAVGVDNRWYNPSKYVWYAATLKCPESTYELEKMVQYSDEKCF